MSEVYYIVSEEDLKQEWVDAAAQTCIATIRFSSPSIITGFRDAILKFEVGRLPVSLHLTDYVPLTHEEMMSELTASKWNNSE